MMFTRNRDAKFRSLEHDQQKWIRFSEKIIVSNKMLGRHNDSKKKSSRSQEFLASALGAAGFKRAIHQIDL